MQVTLANGDTVEITATSRITLTGKEFTDQEKKYNKLQEDYEDALLELRRIKHLELAVDDLTFALKKERALNRTLLKRLTKAANNELTHRVTSKSLERSTAVAKAAVTLVHQHKQENQALKEELKNTVGVTDRFKQEFYGRWG